MTYVLIGIACTVLFALLWAALAVSGSISDDLEMQADAEEDEYW